MAKNDDDGGKKSPNSGNNRGGGGGGGGGHSGLLLIVSLFSAIYSLTISLRIVAPPTLSLADIPNNHHREDQQQAVDFDAPSEMRDAIRRNNNNKKKNAMSSSSNSDVKMLSPSVWSMAGANRDVEVVEMVKSMLSEEKQRKAMELCGKFLYSTLDRAVSMSGDSLGGRQTAFVATGDIPHMWTRDSAVQMAVYMGPRMVEEPWLKWTVAGAIRRQAFNTLQDPYANAYYDVWKDPGKMSLRDAAIGRGGWVATRNYELDSGAYFLSQLYDYYVSLTRDHDGAGSSYRPEALLEETMIFDAVMLMIDVWIIEQNHMKKSKYRYFELPNKGKGLPVSYTGMTWTGFRPSDDACKYGYLVPANVHAAGALERILLLNKLIWQSSQLETKASKLLRDIENGIRTHGVVDAPDKPGEKIYAYEVDGNGNAVVDFDDANVPSLLSIPLLGWSGYDPAVYQNTRKRLLSAKYNQYYYDGKFLTGIGSPHTPTGYVWPMALVIQALTAHAAAEKGHAPSKKEIAEAMTFQMEQLLKSACNDAMHEGVDSRSGCSSFSRHWFEWANALFVVLTETALGERCDEPGRMRFHTEAYDKKVPSVQGRGIQNYKHTNFYQNRYQNDHRSPLYYQGVEAHVKYSQ